MAAAVGDKRISFSSTPTPGSFAVAATDIDIKYFINIIDDDDCGPTECWIQHWEPTQGCTGVKTTPTVASNTAEYYEMATDTRVWMEGSHPNFVVKMASFLENGWGPVNYCFTCDSAK